VTLVLVVDDVRAMSEQYAYDLKRLGGYEVSLADSGQEGLERIAAEAPDCVVLDLEMPGMDGFDVLRALERRGVETPVIVYTGTGNFDRCIQAVRLGAAGFVDKSEPMERIVREIETVLERRRLELEVRALRRRLDTESSLVGDSAPMRTLRETIARLAPIPATVLILGESGSGKELVARDLHQLGPSPRAPFIALNCAAIPENLVESELFGHERGAFTGASATRRGAFEAAERGTLFLDEIGELPLPAQAKLLRVLEERTVTRLGGNRPLRVEARVVAATNRELESEVAAGRFRQDLLYRLNAHVLRVPPLRERLSDVPAIADAILAGVCERFGVRKKRIAADALNALMRYDWARNNVRELRNALERMVIAADGDVIGPEHVPAEILEAAPARSPGGRSFHDLRAEAERQIVVAALERNGWQITRTAEELGLADHASLLKVMRRLGVERPAH
jgi:two-component system, NtrC family, nitrogen regulation response regulator NtrX